MYTHTHKQHHGNYIYCIYYWERIREVKERKTNIKREMKNKQGMMIGEREQRKKE